VTQPPAPRFIDRFGAVIFDMCKTFMFGHDRFGPHEDFFATYQRLGHSRLTHDQVHDAFRRALDVIHFKYNSSDFYEDFPSVHEVFASVAAKPDVDALEEVFTVHEIGRVPAENHAFLRDLAKTHWIGVLSNICAHPDRWVKSSGDAETFALFDHLSFSSTGRAIKPSSVFFAEVLAAAPKGRPILFVGDDINRDIIPAKRLGLGTAWIAERGAAHPDADVVVEKLVDLALLEA
jgi:putative hydrolase of the HAD superfamily/5'-nucleotidase